MEPDGAAQLDTLAHRLDEVEAAMTRLDAGTYGTCESCGAALDEALLEPDPTAGRCAACAP